MSAIAQKTGFISPEEYLEGELSSEVRHEYLDGYVYAMAGASDDHNRIAGNIFGELRERLRGKVCEPFGSDMKLKPPPNFGHVFYYADAIVVCDPTDRSRYYRERPTVIFEVVSPQSERTDRREKAFAYREISTVKTYVIVEQDHMAISVLRRADEGWQSESLEGAEAILKLPMIGVEIPFHRIYERTTLAVRLT
jgi:Uma2 family endonuclease